MTPVRWTTEAAGQLEEIANHIREENPGAAQVMIRTVLDRVAELRRFPFLGRPGERKGTRELVSPPYVVVYRLRKGAAEILHIWHGAQDWR